jgi:hypothetical protein
MLKLILAITTLIVSVGEFNGQLRRKKREQRWTDELLRTAAGWLHSLDS